MVRGGVILALGVALLSACSMHAAEPSAAAAMMQAARSAGQPIGIVLRAGNDLCGERSPSLPEMLPEEPMRRLRLIADAYGYNVDATGAVVQVRPNGGGPPALEKALHHFWGSFPAEDSVMHTMGMLLSGWMMTANGAAGWGISSGSSPDDPVLHLPAGANETSEEIANRIVLLGNKGGWVAWQRPPNADGSAGQVQIVTLGYTNWDDVDAFRCEG